MAGANAETLKRGYDALNRGDLSVVPAQSPDAGTHRGRDSFERERGEEIVDRGQTGGRSAGGAVPDIDAALA